MLYIMSSKMTGWLLALTVTMVAVLGNTVALEKHQQGVREAQQHQQGVREAQQHQQGVREAQQHQQGVREAQQHQQGVREAQQHQQGVREAQQHQQGVREAQQHQQGVREAQQHQQGVREAQQHQQGLREAQQQGLWPPSEGLLLGLEEWFNSPAQRAAEGFPRMLTGNETPYDKSGLDSWVWMYLPSTNPDIVKNEACRNDVNSVYKTLTNSVIFNLVLLKGHYWPLLLPDSWGKVPDGILNGNFQPWGMMEECIGLHVHEFIKNMINTTFDGKYCAISFSDLQNNTDEVSPSVQPRIKLVLPSFPLSFYGTCMPSSCTADDLKVTLDDRLRTFEKKARVVDCQTMQDTVDLNAADIAVIVILCIFGTLLLAGAVCDISINFYNKQHYRKGPLRFLLVFSAYSNLKKIFTINKKENPEVISCIHGMRVLSMTWVVWGHSFFMLFFSSSNILGIQSVTDDVIDETADNATFSVDTFFFIGGLLLTYGILNEYSRVGKVNWIMYYVHRFIRLAPPIALTGAVLATIARHVLYGPMIGYVDRTLIQNCRDFWWADFLFATNFLNRACLGQCWYTAVDTQVYVVLPIVLIPLIYRRKIGVAVLAAVTVISLAIPTILSAVYNVPPTLFFAKAEVAMTKDVDTYATPWCRANSILVGVWAGFLLFSVKGRNIKLRLIVNTCGFLFIGGILAVLLSLMTEGPVIGMEKLLFQRPGRGILDAANGVKSINKLED
ncbi:nose resistant to fluoxetine protein 6 isoform X3 [Cherax quadricarinatus]|uniref:nose resistant to fluoxetine protein 6 isoform X3 n=1 Tax=Cherax quadricarinatus TaxID=27406 RepID=UPI00387E2902